ncbi:hypothetical protein HRbin16_01015 [bacterium HR16]|nr:hypothetical protein HRbin16_01015 [bacterium HR16]
MRHDSGGGIEEWLLIARRDWNRIFRNLQAGDTSAAGYFLQQSLEKYLKAFLLERGWALRKIHDLEVLLDYAINYAPDLDRFYSLCEEVSGYYFADRYPPLGSYEPSQDVLQMQIAQARELVLALFPGETL